MYSAEGNRIILTHYCSAGNQPDFGESAAARGQQANGLQLRSRHGYEDAGRRPHGRPEHHLRGQRPPDANLELQRSRQEGNGPIYIHAYALRQFLVFGHKFLSFGERHCVRSKLQAQPEQSSNRASWLGFKLQTQNGELKTVLTPPTGRQFSRCQAKHQPRNARHQQVDPTSVPMAHTELDGQWNKIRQPSSRVTIPLNSSHPDAPSSRVLKYATISITPSARIIPPSSSVSVATAMMVCVRK